MTTPVDIQTVLEGYRNEVGNALQRAIIAEATSKVLEDQVAQLSADNAQLRSDLSAQLEIHAQADHIVVPQEEAPQEVPDTFKSKPNSKN